MSDTISANALLRKVRILTFDAGKDARDHAAQLGEITCRRGCSNCCRQKVVATGAEGLGIYILLRTQKRWTPALAERLAEEDAHATATNHDEWFMDRRPCIFLDGKSGECSVYAVRPIGCWSTFSVAGDPEKCAGIGPPGTGQLQVNSLHIGSQAAIELLVLLHALDVEVTGESYMTLAGAVLTAAAVAEKTERPDLFSIPIGIAGNELIKLFDEGGKAFTAKKNG